MDNMLQDIKLSDDKSIPINEFYSMIINSLQDYSIFTTDKNLIINCWCAGSVKVFGYKPEEVIGKHCQLIFTEEDIENGVPQEEIDIAIKEGRASANRWHVNKDGDLFYAYGLLFPIKDANDTLIGFVKIHRDLTERKIADDTNKKHIKELEELNTHKENILAILSHDLRSPLGSIIEITDYLKSAMHKMKSSEVKQMIDILYQASTDELNMLDYLLEWARIKHASEAFSPTLMELRPTVTKVYETMNEVAVSNSIRLLNEVDEHIQVYADKKMLLSIIQNLVSNAIKYTPPRGSITISAHTENNKVIIKVEDTGIGIPKDQLEKLFIPRLKTLEQARKENSRAGIGLLLVKGFLEKNGGCIWVESIEGEGSTFYFTLPIEENKEKLVEANTIELGGA